MLKRPLQNIRGSGWSPPPMGFGIGILITGGNLKGGGGGVHKIQTLRRELVEECSRTFFGEEIGGVRGTQTP